MPSRSNSILHIGNFGDYHLLQDLGQGACGKVKLAMNNETGETLAIKIIKRPEIDEEQRSINGKVYSEKKFLEEKLNWEGREKRAVRETSIMKLLRHPHVVKYYDMVTTDSYHYIMMEYAEGGQLLHHIAADGMMCEPEARHYTRQIISALDYMHRNSIVHRDLKVENIMLDRTGRSIKVGDFGLSNTHFPEKRLTTFCGSLYFAAPEVLNGDPYQGPELDVWSLVHKQLIYFKFEPLILHIEASSYESAMHLLNIANQAGYQNSGITVSRRHMLAIRSTLKIDTPIAYIENDTVYCLVDIAYLILLVNMSNEKFQQNIERMSIFEEKMRRELENNQSQVKEETKEERRERKRREGLQKKNQVVKEKVGQQDLEDVSGIF
ncbi:hypothetical protein RMATCC62417_17473 [Rhizopus microsporus]|nr:hypothetical protein RMATCC62417_17473 [Rhizopus microsporus]